MKIPIRLRSGGWAAGVVALLVSLMACGGDAEDEGTGSITPVGENLIVGALHVGSIDDRGYNQAMHEGLVAMKTALPQIELIEVENVPETSYADVVMEDMIAKGARLIFPMSFGYLDPALRVAARHPDVVFEHPAGFKRTENLGTFWSDTVSHEYLMGMVAGLSTQTNKLGWVIGHPVPNILTSINAFQLGARSVNPQATTEVVVNNAWLDPAREAAAVNSLADAGVDVVTMIVDAPTTVVETAAWRGIMSMGFHCVCVQDSAGESWLTGIGFDWGELFTQIARDVMDGSWRSENKIGTLDNGYARIAPYGSAVSAETAALVDQAKAKLTSGELAVFAGPILDNEGAVIIPEGVVAEVPYLLETTDYLVAGVSERLD